MGKFSLPFLSGPVPTSELGFVALVQESREFDRFRPSLMKIGERRSGQRRGEGNRRTDHRRAARRIGDTSNKGGGAPTVAAAATFAQALPLPLRAGSITTYEFPPPPPPPPPPSV